MRSLLRRKAPAYSPTAEATAEASECRDQQIDRGLQGTHDVLAILNGLTDSVIVCMPLKAVLGVAIELVEWTQKARANKKDCAALAQKTLDYMQILSSRVPDTEDVPPKLREDLDTVFSDMRDMCNSLSSLLKKGSFIKAVVLREQIANVIKACQRKLEDSQKHFLVVCAVELRKDVGEVHSDVMEVHKDVRVILQHTIAKVCPIPAEDIQFSAALPPPPLHLFGRHELVDQAISCLISSDSPSHLAILGTGGIGKTSLAVALLHHPKIQEHYGISRYSVPCDSLSSADSLVSALLKTLGASADTKDALNTLITCLQISSPVLVLLDNFESPWMSANQTALTNVLHHLSATVGTKLVITMRADSPPALATIDWTSLQPDVLSPQDAQSLFLGINKQTQLCEYTDLQLLLKEMDYLPLAIKLLAEIKRSTPCSRLLKEWHKKKTSFITTNSPPLQGDRSTSLNISIELSLDSNIVVSVPEAKELLHLLAHLPDGVHVPEGETDAVSHLEQMDLGFEDAYTALKVLSDVALISLDLQGSVKVLSPIRHYMLERPLTNHHLDALHHYYAQLVDKYSCTGPNSTKFLHSLKYLSPEIGNITALLKQLPKDDWTETVKQMALSLAEFQYWDYPSTEIIDLLLACENETSKSGPADAVCAKARLLECRQDYAEAIDLYMKAQGEYYDNGNHLGVAQCLQYLGGIYWVQHRYGEATPKLKQALSEFQGIGCRHGAAHCLGSLGNIHSMQHQYREATAKLEQALSQFQGIGSRLGAAQCLQSLGDIHMMQVQYREATAKLKQALSEFQGIGDRLGAAQCLQSLGNIYMTSSQYEEAISKLEQALSSFQYIEDSLGTSQTFQGLAAVYSSMGDHQRALQILHQSLRFAEACGSLYEVAWCYRYMAENNAHLHQYKKALEAIHTARNIFLPLEAREADVQTCDGYILEWTDNMADISVSAEPSEGGQ